MECLGTGGKRIGIGDLVDCIEWFQKRLRADERTPRGDEIHPRMAPLDPHLHALGWDPAPGKATPEDASLRLDNQPVALVEAARLGSGSPPDADAQ